MDVPARLVTMMVVMLTILIQSVLKTNVYIANISMVNFTAISRANLTILSRQCPNDFNYAQTRESHDGEFIWNGLTQSLVTGSYFWGFLVSQVIFGRFSNLLSFKYLAVGSMVVGVVSTLCTPVMMGAGVYAYIGARILLGFSQGTWLPLLQKWLEGWLPAAEKYQSSSVIYYSTQTGVIIGLPITALTADKIGWQYVFYIQGAVAIIPMALWLYFIYDSPQSHPRISAKEKQFIIGTTVDAPVTLEIPWKQLLKSNPFWALLLTSVAGSWGYYSLLAGLPIYLKSLMNFDAMTISWMISGAHFFLCLFAAVISSLVTAIINKRWLTLSATRKLINSIGLGGSAVCLLVRCVIGCHWIATMALPLLAIGLHGACYSGYHLNHVDIASNFSATIYELISAFSSIASWLGPLFVGLLMEFRMILTQWQIIFCSIAAVMVLACVVFVALGSAEERTWNQPEKKPTESPATVAQFKEIPIDLEQEA